MPKEIMGVTLYTLPEAVEILGVTSVTVRSYLKQGKLKGQKIGRKWHITAESLKAFVSGKQIDLGA
jgi:excisionase family DNA binding protein